jgi:CTD small phosphatase-like protein 2
MTRNSQAVTLVLDLDETLVHCSVEGGGPADLVFPVNFNGVQYQVGVKLRPFMDRFLRSVADKFEVVVFTASQQVYADTLLDIIDPKRELIKHRLFRDSCR